MYRSGWRTSGPPWPSGVRRGFASTSIPPLFGARNAFITFADPATTGGLLIELLQYPKEGEEIPGQV